MSDLPPPSNVKIPGVFGDKKNPYGEFPYDQIVGVRWAGGFAVLTITAYSGTTVFPDCDLTIPQSKNGFDDGDTVPYDPPPPAQPDSWKTPIDPNTGQPQSPGISSACIAFDSPNTNIDHVYTPAQPVPDPKQTQIFYTGVIGPGSFDVGTLTFQYPFDGTDYYHGVQRDFQTTSDFLAKQSGILHANYPGGTTNYPSNAPPDPLSGRSRAGTTEVVSGFSWDSSPPTDGVILEGGVQVPLGLRSAGTFAWPGHLFFNGLPLQPGIAQPGPVRYQRWGVFPPVGVTGTDPPPMLVAWNAFGDGFPTSWDGVRIETYPTPGEPKPGYSTRSVQLFNFGQMQKDKKGQPSAGPNNDPTLVTIYNSWFSNPNDPAGDAVGYNNQYRLQLYRNPNLVVGPEFTVIGVAPTGQPPAGGNPPWYDVTKTVGWNSTPDGVQTQILQFNQQGWAVGTGVPVTPS